MDNITYFLYFWLKESQSTWVCQHHTCYIVTHDFLELIYVHVAIRVRLYLNNFISKDGCTCRVCSMGGIWHDYLVSLSVSPFPMIGFHYHESRQFTVCTGGWLERHLVHPCNLFQRFPQLIHHFQCPLDGFFRLERV